MYYHSMGSNSPKGCGHVAGQRLRSIFQTQCMPGHLMYRISDRMVRSFGSNRGLMMPCPLGHSLTHHSLGKDAPTTELLYCRRCMLRQHVRQ